jgi:Tfp pilus assembly protein PilZ
MVISATSALTFLPAMILVLKRFLFDKRQSPRLKAPVYYRSASYPELRKSVVNISLGGICIHSDEKLKIGERQELELLLPNDMVLPCIVRVVWQRPLSPEAETAYDVGLRFTNLSDNILRRLAEVLKQATESGQAG